MFGWWLEVFEEVGVLSEFVGGEVVKEEEGKCSMVEMIC